MTPDATGLTDIPECGLEDVTTFLNLSSDIHQEFNENDFELNFLQNTFDKEIFNLSEVKNNENSLVCTTIVFKYNTASFCNRR